MISKACRCGGIIRNGKCSKCKRGSRLVEYQRGNSAERGYDRKWRKARAVYLAENPLCVYCEREGILEPATVVDHIHPHRGDRVLFWNEHNWQALCKACHDAKTRRGE